jgi:hypothetical protein
VPLRPAHPPLPADLLDRFGTPEHAFGPSLRFRVVATACGAVFLVTGALFFAAGLGGNPMNAWVGGKLAAPLAALGIVVLVGERLAPKVWVVVCPRGVLRSRGSTWTGVRWADVARFEDATTTAGVVTTRQCRLVLADGTHWGFLADRVAEYDRLFEAIRRAVEERRGPPGPG